MREFLECQTCGEVLRELTIEEARQVAEKPYNFVTYCPPCKKEMERAVRRAGFHLSAL